jgi:hypothetical protein
MANSGVLYRSPFPIPWPATHGNQILYFGPDGLLRRHGYTVDVLGNAPGLNYASDYRATNDDLITFNPVDLRRVPQTLYHRLQDLGRKRVLRYGMGQQHIPWLEWHIR